MAMALSCAWSARCCLLVGVVPAWSATVLVHTNDQWLFVLGLIQWKVLVECCPNVLLWVNWPYIFASIELEQETKCYIYPAFFIQLQSRLWMAEIEIRKRFGQRDSNLFGCSNHKHWGFRTMSERVSPTLQFCSLHTFQSMIDTK